MTVAELVLILKHLYPQEMVVHYTDGERTDWVTPIERVRVEDGKVVFE